MITRFLLSAVLIVALQSQLHRAYAATFTENDYARASTLQDQLQRLMRDVIDASKGATYNASSYECLSNIYFDLTGVSDNLGEVIDLVGLSTNMQTLADERVVNMTLAEKLRFARQAVAVLRNSVNLNAGHCGQDSNVTDKARQALGIFSQLDGILAMLQRKLGIVQ